MAKPTLSSAWVSSVGGLALLAGSIAFVVHVVLRSVVTAGTDPIVATTGGSWVPISVLGLVGAILVLLGMPAVVPQISGGRASIIGLGLLVASWAFFGVFLSFYGLLVLPWLAHRAPALVAAGAPLPTAFIVTFAIALLSWVVGAVLIAVPFIRRRAEPTWAGYVLLASSVALVVGNLVIAPSGPASNLALNLLSNLGPVLLLVAVGYLGFRLWSENSTAKVRP